MTWFEEGRCFTGPGGNALFSVCRRDTTRVSFSDRETAVVTFVAPTTGRYVLQVAIVGWMRGGINNLMVRVGLM